LIGLWVQVLRVPYGLLFPLILLFCLIGAYSLNFATFDILIMIVFGVIGYLMKKADYEAAPLILAMVLGGIFENALRQSLILSDGSPLIFFTRPIAAAFLWTAIALIILPGHIHLPLRFTAWISSISSVMNIPKYGGNCTILLRTSCPIRRPVLKAVA
jgi:putative tricarboxylic transport membrane protein